MIPSFIDKSKIPHKSGVYIYKNSQKRVLYVGKAIDLYSRVSSYFNKDIEGKTAALVSEIALLDTIIVESELEALILEANLIKKFLPPYNIRLRDDKDFLYIGISNEIFPKVVTIRKQDLKLMNKFFGPFPSAKTVRNTLKLLRRVFPWCSNPPKSNAKSQKACFYYHIGLCPGACIGVISQPTYQKIIKRFTKFMEGKKEELVSDLLSEMDDLALNQKFEEAAKLKKTLDGIMYLTQTNRTQSYLENPNFLEDEKLQSLYQLQKDLNLKALPERIEGYDISNLQGKEAVGSMVVLTHGEIDKSQYRKFKMRVSGKPNDVGMHREMMRRRLNHPEWPFPDLIIIDGGRGQVRGVFETIKQFSTVTIPIFGLAKRMEWLYPPEGAIIKLPKKSLSLRMLQKLRDESHRFAIAYHRKLRDMIKG